MLLHVATLHAIHSMRLHCMKVISIIFLRFLMLIVRGNINMQNKCSEELRVDKLSSLQRSHNDNSVKFHIELDHHQCLHDA